jgi:hypothetical protein
MRRRVLEELQRIGGSKYERPLTGQGLAGINVFGGHWNEYGQVVFSALILETMLDIDARLETLVKLLGGDPEEGLAPVPQPPSAKDLGYGLTDDPLDLPY